MGWLFIGVFVVTQGGLFLGMGILFHLLFGEISGFHFSLVPFHLSFDLHVVMIIGGFVATVVGVFLIGYGVMLYRRERAWDQKFGEPDAF